jgi:short-subunit dehydrogenase
MGEFEPHNSIYNASKFATEGFTEVINKEFKPEWNIYETIIQPGGFRADWSGSSMVHTTELPEYQDSMPTKLL